MKFGPYQHYVKTDPRIGRRVELPTWSDQWMMGARFGVVRHVVHDSRRENGPPGENDILFVKCDHSHIRRQYKHFSKSFNFI